MRHVLWSTNIKSLILGALTSLALAGLLIPASPAHADVRQHVLISVTLDPDEYVPEMVSLMTDMGRDGPRGFGCWR